MLEQKPSLEESETPILDIFKKHGFNLDALVLSSKRPSDRKSHTELGRFIAILDTNYQLQGKMNSTLFAYARAQVLAFLDKKHKIGDNEDLPSSRLYTEVREALGSSYNGAN